MMTLETPYLRFAVRRVHIREVSGSSPYTPTLIAKAIIGNREFKILGAHSTHMRQKPTTPLLHTHNNYIASLSRLSQRSVISPTRLFRCRRMVAGGRASRKDWP